MLQGRTEGEDLIGGALKVLQFASGDVLWKLANIVLLAVAARVLPEDEAALVVLSQTASMILLSLGDLGFRSAGIRLIAVDASQTSEIMRAVFRKRLVSVTLIGLPAALICAAVLTDNLRAFLGLALIIVAYLPYFAASDWVLLARGRAGLAGATRAIYALVLLSLSALVYAIGANLVEFALIIGAGYGVFAATSLALLKYSEAETSDPESGAARLSVQSELAWSASLALAVAFALNTLFHSIEILLAGAFLGESASAAFAAPFRLVFSLYAIGWILSQYFSPHFARFSTSQGWMLYACGFLAAGVLVAVATYLCAHQLVGLVYGDAFAQAGFVLRALAPTLALDAVVACLGTVLVMQNKGKTSAATIGLGCVASIVVFWFCKDSGVMGAVYAKYAAYITLVSTQLFCLLLLGSVTGKIQRV